MSDGATPFKSFEQQSEASHDQESADIMDYWNSVAMDGRVLTAQLEDWQRFRKFQQKVRKRPDWQGYLDEVQNRRETYGLQRNVILEKDPKVQDKLTTWLEYQELEHRLQERLQNLFDTNQETFAARLAELGEDNIPEFLKIGTQDYVPFGRIVMLDNQCIEADSMVHLAEIKVAHVRDKLTRASRYNKGPIIKSAWCLMEVVALRVKVESSKEYWDKITTDEYRHYLNELEHAENELLNARTSPEETFERDTWIAKLQEELKSGLSELEESKARRQHLG